ncbi:AfsR/SARP family transcriptional regulator [Nonomuraea sp. SMC257]|uniref:AfsR/SARP family transcriptional regulator n=1 Tax=Nonomuraea montanisoli TaxID=2741721 RepID=A0A7Y6IC55_9ACTN|nr:BTAD domain-containing putative transcriptional regulator [Nonomuraea montanisoli]NUW35361.1 AfsR/SARP family transcriptional regulator [Nonomuraea montanisoli]
MRFGVLGPLAVWADDGGPVRVAEPKVRALLADLLAHGGGPVPADRLIDDLWDERLPRNPAGTLQARVSQLRRALGVPGLITYGPAGYRLAPADTDASRFLALVGRDGPGRAPSWGAAPGEAEVVPPRERLARLDEALALWRGPAYAEFADAGFARPEIARLEEARLAALEERAEARLALGEDAELAGLVALHPLRERLRALHILALYRRGRQSEALASYGELRDLLADELGLDPSPELRALHGAILRQDPALGMHALTGPSAALSAPVLGASTPGPRAASGTAATSGAPAPPDGPAPADGPATSGEPAAPDVPPTSGGPAASDAVAASGASGARHRPVTNLPAALSDLVGRDGELAAVRDLLAASRLVTLTGPGGVGKTRLALEAARARTGPGEFPDGMWLVELAGTGDVAEAVAAVLGVRDDGAGPLPPRLARALAGKRALIVLDNCEHVVADAAGLVARLLKAAPGLRVLATSQEPLGVTGERLLPVAPLPEPEAVRLFAARAGVEPDDAVATICRRLDGIPLALELAATRVRALGVRGVAERLDDRFRLLSAGMRDAPARQRTLRAAIDWSWELLTEPERVVLRRLSVHADGCTLEAAEEVCAEPGVDVLDAVARLVDRSLVVVTPGPRYRLLESVSAYCAERLAEAGELDVVRERHARHYTELAVRAELRGPRQVEWLERLDLETANLRLALAGPEPLRLVNALTWYWYLRGRLGEARRSLTAALARAGAPATPAPVPAEAAVASVWLAGMTLLSGETPAEVLCAGLDAHADALASWFLSHVRWAYGDQEEHRAAADRALAVFDGMGDRWGVAATLALRAKLDLVRGDLDAMRRDGERSLAMFTELGDDWGRMEAMDALDRLAEARGDHAEAARLREEGLRLAERLGFEVPFKLSALGRIALLAGDYAAADERHERARRLAVAQSYKAAEEYAVLGLAVSARRQGRYAEAEALLTPWLGWLREVRGTPGIAFVMAELGFAAEQRGDTATALARQRAGHEAARASGDPRAVALALEGLAGAVSLAGDQTEAARLLGAAAATREAAGAPLPAAERLDVDRITTRVREALGEAVWHDAYTSGRRGSGEGEQGAHSSGEGEPHSSGEGELGHHFPGALGGRARVQPAAERLHPLGHPDQSEPAAQPREPRIRR